MQEPMSILRSSALVFRHRLVDSRRHRPANFPRQVAQLTARCLLRAISGVIVQWCLHAARGHPLRACSSVPEKRVLAGAQCSDGTRVFINGVVGIATSFDTCLEDRG
jgi:hypothetical protein